MTQTYFRNFGSIYWFFCKQNVCVLLIILLPLDKILRFFCVVIYICIYICIQYRIIEPRIVFRKLGQFTCFLLKNLFLFITL